MSDQSTSVIHFPERKAVCLICRERFRRVTNTHLKLHGLTVAEYRLSFLGTPSRIRSTRHQRYLTAQQGIRQGLPYVMTYVESHRSDSYMGGLEGPPKPPNARTRPGPAVARLDTVIPTRATMRA